MVDKELAKEWIDALLSGNYEQGRGKLQTKDGKFCCLGVLCDTQVKKGLGEWIAREGQPFFFDSKNENSEVLPGKLAHRLGFENEAGGVTWWTVKNALSGDRVKQMVWLGAVTVLSEINDKSNGASFKEIAKILIVHFNLTDEYDLKEI